MSIHPKLVLIYRVFFKQFKMLLLLKTFGGPREIFGSIQHTPDFGEGWSRVILGVATHLLSV